MIISCIVSIWKMAAATCDGHDYKRICLQSGTGRTLELPFPCLSLSLPSAHSTRERRDGARPREQVNRAPAPELTDTHTHGVKMAMRAALRCLSANFYPRVPQLSGAAQLTATRRLWRSGCPRTLSTTTPVWCAGNSNPMDSVNTAAVRGTRGLLTHSCLSRFLGFFLVTFSPAERRNATRRAALGRSATWLFCVRENFALIQPGVGPEPDSRACCCCSFHVKTVAQQHRIVSVINERQHQISVSCAPRGGLLHF